MFETLGPAPRHHRGRERPRLPRGLEGAHHLRERRAGQGPRHPRDRRGREPRRHPHARPPVPLRPGPQPRHPRGVPGARLSDPVDALDPEGREYLDALLQTRSSKRAHHATPLELNRRVAGELLGQQRAEGVGREVRGAPPERRRPRSLVVQVRPRRADLRPHRHHHLGAARRPTRRCTTSTRTSRAARSRSASRRTPTRSSSTRSASRTRARRRASSLAPIDRRSASSCSSSRPKPSSTARARARPRARAADRGAAREGSAYGHRPGRRAPRAEPEGAREARRDEGRDHRSARHHAERVDGVIRASATNAAERPDANMMRPDHGDTETRQALKKLPIAGQARRRHRRRAGQVRGRGARAPRPRQRRRAVGRRDGEPAVHEEPARRHDAARLGGLTMAHDFFLIEGALKGLGYNVMTLDVPDQRRAPLRQGVRQPRPVQPDVLHRRQPGEVPHQPARQAGHVGRGHRQELRLPHRGRVRPVPLRHVRHRVPQGAARRRLRRLPRHALPAEGRPQAGHGRRRRPRDEPAVLHRGSSRRIIAGDVINAIGYRLRPYEVEPGATDRAREGQEDHLRRARRKGEHLLGALEVRGASSRGQGRQAAPEAEGVASSASSGR